jgi:hypothetical protein
MSHLALACGIIYGQSANWKKVKKKVLELQMRIAKAV